MVPACRREHWRESVPPTHPVLELALSALNQEEMCEHIMQLGLGAIGTPSPPNPLNTSNGTEG